jgi:hypothetical protein
MTQSWPQPFEGVRGTDLSGHWLLSLDERAILHREALIAMAHHLHTATLVGSPAPVVRRMSDRLHQPGPGDLAVTIEVLHGRPDPDSRLRGFGIYLGGRKEWCESDAEWAAWCAAERDSILRDYSGTEADELIAMTVGEDNRTADTVFYLQYGPDPGDICRWHNSEAIVLPVAIGGFGADAAVSREELGSGRVRTTFTRDSLISGLADSGFRLRGLSGELPEDDGETDLLVTVRVPSGQITRVEDAGFPAGTVA